jgi:DNA-binding winged helix-turn-helix (wHTH) protein/pimeloyl-ACP methyl ester carboxylesterase
VAPRGNRLIYTFENHLLDTDRRELRRGEEVVAIEPQVFDVLEYLVSNRERVVSNEDLIATVWKGRIVSGSTLSSRITAVRHAVGDSGERQGLIRTIPRKGYRFVGQVREKQRANGDNDVTPQTPAAERADGATLAPPKQPVRFCRTKDGVNLAVASVGEGPVLVRSGTWATHIEYDWKSPLTGPLLQRLAARFRLVRYDGRGSGLSDRNVNQVSFSTLLEDLETVADTLGLERFMLFGFYGAAAVSAAYAMRHPHRVSKLALFGGYAQGRNKRNSAAAADEHRFLMTLLRTGWGEERPAFLRALSSLWLPSATPEQSGWFLDLSRASHFAEDSIKLGTAVDNIDVMELLPKIITPTIVFHCIRDNFVPFDLGRQLACSIPNARFVALDSENHAVLAEEPAWRKMVEELEAFLIE